MALVARSTTASIDANQAVQVSAGLLAGEALDLVSACYIKTTDGLVYMTDATAVNEAAEVVGFTARAVGIGQPVTLFGPGSRFKYGTALTIGNVLYAAATAGRLDTAATTGDTFGYARVESATDIVIVRTMPPLVTAVIGDGTVALTKLANLTRGSMISGQTAGNIPTALVAKDNGKILVGDGTDVNSVAVSGDVTLANTGAVTIAAVSVEESMVEVGAAGAGLSGLITKFLAADAVIGGIPVVHWMHVHAAAAGTSKSIALTHKTKVVFCVVIPVTTVANSTGKLVNAAVGDITNAMITTPADTIAVPTTMATANLDIVAGTNLTFTNVAGASAPELNVFVFGFRVA